MSKFNNLVWSDEFDGTEINRDDWSYEIGYIRNNELQYYTDSPENAYIEDGCLVIEAKETGDAERPYTSASLNTKHKQTFLYGRLEMRAKLPFGKGIWPAFWTLGDNHWGDPEPYEEGVPWPECGEIDIMEMIGGINKTHATCPFEDHMGNNVVQATIHYPDEKKALQRAAELKEGNYCDDFHVFGIEWDENCIKAYMDDVVYNKLDITDIECFHKPHYCMLNIAIGGWWPGNPDETSVFPQKYYIDYVRYYK